MNYLILDKLGVRAEDAVYVGDTEIDIATAKNTGMDLIMVSWGFRPVSYQKALGAKTIAHDAKEIFALVSGGFTEAEQKELITMTAYACRGDGNLLREVIAATEGDPLRFTDAERVWAEALLEKLRAD
jgi:hypothetical protein